jgi:hypothetical protein
MRLFHLPYILLHLQIFFIWVLTFYSQTALAAQRKKEKAPAATDA